MTDEQLVENLQKGDEKALGELIVRYQQKLYFYVAKLINSGDDAEDVVQETFLKIYQNIQSFDLDKKFSPWAYRIAHNQAINLVKKRGRLQSVEAVNLDWYVEHEQEIEDFLAKEERSELSKEMISLMNGLRQEYKDVLLLYFFEEKSYEEISEILQIPKATAGAWLNRAKEQLRKKLSTYGNEKR
jgi:RNA polymerase sigma-70 factor (ECF subfamily)